MTRCALVGPIEPNMTHLVSHGFDKIVAVDAGYSACKEAEVDIALALGDFDSLGFTPEDVPVVSYPVRKDATDMSLALDWAAGTGMDEVLVYGAFSARLDHTFANLQLLAKSAHRGAKVVGITDDTALLCLTGGMNDRLDVAARGAQGTFSVFAMDEWVQGVSEQGVSYEIDGVDLVNEEPLGVSNEFVGKDARITVKSGTLLVFLPLDAFEYAILSKQ